MSFPCISLLISILAYDALGVHYYLIMSERYMEIVTLQERPFTGFIPVHESLKHCNFTVRIIGNFLAFYDLLTT